VLKFYEAYEFRGKLWIFLEYMDGGCLTPIIEEMKGSIPENVCCYLLFETLKGLYNLHLKNVMHRDIKSDNILINE